MKKNAFIAAFLIGIGGLSAQTLSSVWVPDLGNGKYKNPIINADYSDPDVCRVGDDYYMTSSSFNCIPALQILHSNDLVNWTIIGAAAERLKPEADFSKPQHGNGVWAPSIRYHEGEFYVCYGDPDRGIYMIKTKDPAGHWDEPILLFPATGLIDPCPFWDEDGRAYVAHGYAGSRAGVKSIIGMFEMTPDGTAVIGSDHVVYDGHRENETIEGAKMYKRNGYYYIFSPAGGVATGWQVVLRAENPWGPYEARTVMAQGSTSINGPHQGAWVDTPDGKEDWFIHFQDKGAYGRVVHLQPMQWLDNDWPVIGVDKDGDGCGEPVLTYTKPNVGKSYPKATPSESDEFDDVNLGLQWQWHGNPNALWYFCDAAASTLRLFSNYTEGMKSLYDVPNLLLQKFPAEEFTATAKVAFFPRVNKDKVMTGERAGMVIMGLDYAVLALDSRDDGIYLVQADCKKAEKGGVEKENASVRLEDNALYLKITVKQIGTKNPTKKEHYKCVCSFAYSLDGKKFTPFGTPFIAKEGQWIGAKVGLFCTRTWESNDSGWLDVDWFRIARN
ncbi:MAG: glycoside hydrolase 43 family protein [Porphyromonadaceae bacterium]|nr:glycoside hydrolase 43 family protein [Porphyromonadaceae bacterium]